MADSYVAVDQLYYAPKTWLRVAYRLHTVINYEQYVLGRSAELENVRGLQPRGQEAPSSVEIACNLYVRLAGLSYGEYRTTVQEPRPEYVLSLLATGDGSVTETHSGDESVFKLNSSHSTAQLPGIAFEVWVQHGLVQVVNLDQPTPSHFLVKEWLSIDGYGSVGAIGWDKDWKISRVLSIGNARCP